MLEMIRYDKNTIDIVSQRNTDNQALSTVREIIDNVIKFKDKAVMAYTTLYDQIELNDYKVSKEEINLAFQNTDQTLIKDLEIAAKNIRRFHECQLTKPFQYDVEIDSVVGQLVRPINRVGIYVPGGTAAYPSTVLMNAIPANVASVKEIVMISPPNKEGKISDIILAAAKIAGVTEIYKVGGAQGIAALAYGTETIKPVSKIVGPGNVYVAQAKKEVFGKVGIDMIAGPSEVLIYADESSHSTFVAADLLAQAEHDRLARPLLVTNSQSLIQSVNKQLEIQLETLPRKSIAKEALDNNGYAILVKNRQEAIDVINEIAPEHLELMVSDANQLIPFIMNAGAIFVGEYSPEPLGDYIAGPNHTLPTSGSARFSSPLSTDDFMKKTSYINFTKKGLETYQESIRRIANREGLDAHANAIKVRF